MPFIINVLRIKRKGVNSKLALREHMLFSNIEVTILLSICSMKVFLHLKYLIFSFMRLNFDSQNS